ncbi:hypothetical protein HHK36_013428 [Tetracentron sinense]|uniref:HMA domain-containing protein n=1 Tax=Tetracentron sinense TaxID=13715 RepID=A0A834ZDI5_TETSI|nr:hypothetical protein HHK36_013428 [Tetracentron sinense]
MEVVELKVRIHCKACEKAVRKSLCKIKGVRCVEIDVILNKITVMGYLERKKSITRGFTSSSVSAINSKVKDLVCKGLFDQTLKFYKQDLHPSALHLNYSIILPSVIKASSSPQFLHFGLQLHSFALKTGSDSEPVTSNSLLSMHSKCSNIDSARRLFDTMLLRDTITWNSMITCYNQNGYCVEALEMFKEMCFYCFEPKPEVIASVLSVCGRMGDLGLGREIHARVVCDGRIVQSIFLSTALVDMYSRCFELPMAFRVFNQMIERNEVSWTAMIAGCTANESYNMSLNVFRAMQFEGIKPNRVTLITVLPACTELDAIEHGKEIHGHVFRHGFDSESHIAAALIDMYCKCREAFRYARLIFERLEERDVVVWSSMIGRYSQNGDGDGDGTDKMKLFHRMRVEGIEPNSVTLLAIIAACTTLSSVNHGRGVHGYILKSGLNSDIFISNSLINMYAKCGFIHASHQIFKEMPARDPVSWTALIQGYGLHGYGTEALQLFNEMRERKIEPDGITVLAVLSACNYAGLIEEGQRLFNHMMQDSNIELTVQHYACYIDLLGRSGKLEDACEVVIRLPMKPSATIWSCLVSACKAHNRLEVAEMLAHRLIDLEPENAANYTLLCMVYAETGEWVHIEEVRRVMRVRGVKKSSGFSRIEIENWGL